MTLEQATQGVVDAVVVYDGRLLLVNPQGNGWALPSGGPELAETPQATAARLVYELTGYLVDGSSLLRQEGPDGPGLADTESAVLCQLLSEDPSSEARLAPDQLRWISFTEAIADAGLPEPVRTYLKGHMPV
jgi:8-oxo-dGTP pyrophosphatase MutT (NUDIX family)